MPFGGFHGDVQHSERENGHPRHGLDPYAVDPPSDADEAIYMDGRQIKFPPKYFLGAAGSPYASEPRIQAIREHKKVNAGAQFFQTNLVYDADKLDDWLEALEKRGILDKVFILIGITPLKSLKVANYMNEEVPGVTIPEKLVKRMEAAGDKAEEEGVQIALELIRRSRTRKASMGSI